ncbi:MAG: NAD(P)H-dependent glycerol-3-phosphate dehydrogenase [Pseudomonadota bacterium]
MKKIGIIGAGAWGTALAQNLSNSGLDVMLWAREEDVANSINTEHKNNLFLKDLPLNESIKASHNKDDLSGCDLYILMTPAQHLRSIIDDFANIIKDNPFVIGSKGIEIETGSLLSDVVLEKLPDAIFGFMSGPTFAGEIAKGLPCAITLAMNNREVGKEIVKSIGSRTLRTYLSNDIIGVQIGGSVKNVIAIACGVIEGRGMGESARCALVTRGLAEMARLAKALGAEKETLMGMCGIGDLMLTCSSMQSRNFSFGYELGQGKSVEEILSERQAVTEGVHTAKALYTIAQNNAVDMPISNAVYEFITEDVKIDEIFSRLLDRPLREENI